jgi:hypothetical protein
LKVSAADQRVEQLFSSNKPDEASINAPVHRLAISSKSIIHRATKAVFNSVKWENNSLIKFVRRYFNGIKIVHTFIKESGLVSGKSKVTYILFYQYNPILDKLSEVV